MADKRIRIPFIPMDLRWRAHAACREVDGEVFFNPDDMDKASIGSGSRPEDQAKNVCAGCAVQPQCLNWAVVVGEPYGIWGGLTPGERQRLTGQWDNAV